MKVNNNSLALGVLIKRNIKLYLKDRMLVFFSVLAPIIVLALYILFLGDLQSDMIFAELQEYGLEDILTAKDVSALINNWMVAGLMGVSCITVCINTNMIMLKDKQSGTINDMFSSPVRKWVIYLSYIISCVIITFAICIIVLFIAIIYLACSGGLMMSFVDFLAIIGITIISVISASFFMVLVCGFLKTAGSLAAVNGVISTAAGFLIGAYMPFSMLPPAIKYIACFIPGAYSVGLFKEYFLHGCINRLQAKLPADSDIMDKLKQKFSLDLDFFGTKVSTSWMTLVLIISIIIFALLMVIFYSNKRTNFFEKRIKRAKRLKKKIKS